MKQILYLHEGESIAYLIDRIENYPDNEIYLNIDSNLALFSDVTNLKLLKRELDFFNKKITIISDNQEVLSFAESLGFDVEEESDDAGEVHAVSGKKNTAIDDSEDDSDFFDNDQKEDVGAPIENIHKPAFLQSEDEDDHKEIDLSASEHDMSGSTFYKKEDIEKSDRAGDFFEKTMKQRSDAKENIFSDRSEDVRRAKENINARTRGMFANKKMLSIVAVVLIVVISAGVFVFQSKATLDINIKKETIDFTFPVSSDSAITNVDLENGKIPGQIIKLEHEVSGEFDASGASSGATKSSGKITVYNEYSSEAQPLVAKTRFQTPDGKVFRITNRVTIPGAKMSGGKVESPGILEVEVVADQPGSEYNIGPSDFKVPGFEGTEKYDGFYAKSAVSMEGGSFGESRAISASDLQKAKETLTKKLEDEKSSYVNSNTPKNLTVLEGAIHMELSELDAPAEGSAANKFTASLKVVYDVFVFDQKDIESLAENSLSLRIKEGRKTYPETKIISYEKGVFNLDKSLLAFTVHASEVVGGDIDVDNLKDELKDKGEIEIRKILTVKDSIESAEITLWPFWSSKAPANPDKIFINIKE